MGFDAIVLAGGRSRRMGGADKAVLLLGGRTLLDLVLSALDGAERVVVVGPKRWDRAGVLWTKEDPAGSGPAAALDAGLKLVRAGTVVVVGVDHPFVTAELVATLVRALDEDGDGVAVADGDGVPQPLVAAYRTESLRRATSALPHRAGAALREITASLQLELVEDLPAARDIDTPADLEAARSNDAPNERP